MSTQLEHGSAISLTSDEMEVVEGSESITLTIQEEEGYKRMDLKGESESDKDLIIYSLNESLQIHKEIVERTQNEKDDMEDQFEQERSVRYHAQHQAEALAKDGNSELGKLQAIYNSIAKELEAKQLDYQRMETKFLSHVKSSESSQDMTSVYTLLDEMIGRIHNLCVSSICKEDASEYIMKCYMDNSMVQQHFIQPVDRKDIAFLIEKYMMDILLQDIFKTTIHPGVSSLNTSFGVIHDWIKKRNTSWASRLKQQITHFVKQSNEQSDQIDLAKEEIGQKILHFLSHFYDNIHLLKQHVLTLVNEACELNLLLKSQENTVEIMSISQGTQYNKDIMSAVNPGDHVLFVISPPFVASSFVIPAKVYCV